MAVIDNVHERVLPVPADQAGRLLDRVGAPGDPLWPSPTWIPMRFDRPLSVGADGGHGPVRYHVSGYEPGRRITFTFDPRIGLTGTHTIEVEPRDPHSCVLRHRITATSTGTMRLMWPALVRVCHDTVLEHLLDNAELAVTGTIARPVRYPWRARLAVAVESTRLRTVPVPENAVLLRAALPHPDLADAFAVRVPPGTSTDPQTWADAIFRNPPPAVVALLRLRNLLVAPFGIERGDRSAFGTVGRGDHEVLLGTDAGHLDFRAAVLTEPDDDGTTVTVATHATVHSRAGRAYLAVVRLFHPPVVKAMLRRAARVAVAPRRREQLVSR
ncbi:DUF2867 domain-containing protein [Actinoplanes teichomyceticus]|uniref:Uncharacterized protein DUF2867 n=1 Tax=Actinoplanes teichomyceticus TaxID=1867 RepID=A0A561WC08_ACTTI|nr:DUF2867 domain-containing protein [Actinoplanes teichomyceticus]TWG21373.1 uncharacterized protein DUF2867 [Actinoplanes teichomyceticus]GIF16461.1 hypothetical protein Ate01nite_64930 [Actinoplanes teichomyceticus]